MTNPVAGNQWFTNVNNTVVSPNALLNAKQSGGLDPIWQVEGTFAPRSAGTYSFSGPNGDNIQVPNNAVLISAVLSADVAVVGGGTSVPFLSSAATGFTGAHIGLPINNATINGGAAATGPDGPFIGTASPWVRARTTGTQTAGVIRGRFAFAQVQPGT